MNAVLYQSTNLLNGKIYIGVASGQRMRNPRYFGSGIAIKKAVAKHGWRNFRRKDLAAFDSRKEAFEAEAEIVNAEWIADPSNYNLRPGGGRDYGKGDSAETKARKSASAKRRWKEGRNKNLQARKDWQKISKPCVVKGEHFQSISEASRHFGISRAAIRYWIRKGK